MQDDERGGGAPMTQALTDLSLEDAFSEVVKELWDESADVAASGVGMRRKGTHSTAPSEAGDGGARSQRRSHRHRSHHRRSVSSSRSRSRSHSRDEHHHPPRRDNQQRRLSSQQRPSQRHSRRSPGSGSERSHAPAAAAAKGDAGGAAPDDEVKSIKSQVPAPFQHLPVSSKVSLFDCSGPV